MSDLLPSSGLPRAEFQTPAAYLEWLGGFHRRRLSRVQELSAAMAKGDDGARQEWKLRSTTGIGGVGSAPWTGPSPARVEELSVHFQRCVHFTKDEVVGLADAWATVALDGLASSYRDAISRSRQLALAIDAIGPVLGAVTVLRPIFIALLDQYFEVRKDLNSIGNDRAYAAAAFRAETIVLGDVLDARDEATLSEPWQIATGA
jgi:hypothetical protein